MREPYTPQNAVYEARTSDNKLGEVKTLKMHDYSLSWDR